ncbi:MAG: hypothetical protein ACRCWI_02745 [Brevinema sp.]
MANNKAQKEIANGYAILFWDELENEQLTRNPMLIGAGVSSIISVLGDITFQMSSGESWNTLDINSILKSATLGGLIGSRFPITLSTKLIYFAIGKDLSFVVASSIIGGTIKGTTDLPFIGEVITSYVLMFLGHNNAFGAVVANLRLVVEEVYDQMSNKTTKDKLTGQKIENPSGIEQRTKTPSNGGGSTGGGNGNDNRSGPIGSGGIGGSTGGNSKPSGSGGGCINSNHSDSNTGGHNYRSPCIYAWHDSE